MQIGRVILGLLFLSAAASADPQTTEVAGYVDAVLGDFTAAYPDAPAEVLRSAWFFGGRQIDRHQFPDVPSTSRGPWRADRVSYAPQFKQLFLAAGLFVPLFAIFHGTDRLDVKILATGGLTMMELFVLIYPGLRQRIKDYFRLSQVHVRRTRAVLRRHPYPFADLPRERYLEILEKVTGEKAEELKRETDEIFARIAEGGLGWEGERFRGEILPRYLRLWTLGAILKIERDRRSAGNSRPASPFYERVVNWIEDCRIKIVATF